MTTKTVPGFELKLFGTPQLSRNGDVIRLTRRKTAALLAYLALAERPQTRDRLAALLWPDKPGTLALASLRTVLHEVAGIGNIVRIDGDLLEFRPEQCTVDVRKFVEATSAVREAVTAATEVSARDASAGVTEPDHSDWLEAAEIYTDEFLRGFSLRDAPEFDDWIFFTAESLQTRLASLLAGLVEHLTPIDTTAAIFHAQRLVQIEELDEDHHRALIELYVTEGRFSAAIRQFERCREVLARELQEEPSKDLVELYESLKGKADSVPEPTSAGSGYLAVSAPPRLAAPVPLWQRAFGQSVLVRQFRISAFILALLVTTPLATLVVADHVPVAPPKIPSIMVLPFETVSADEAMPAIARGLARFIETRLLKDTGLNVPRAGAIDAGTRSADELRKIGRRERVDFLLDGTVAGTREAWSAAVQLIDVRSGNLLYSRDIIPSTDDIDVDLRVVAQEIAGRLYERLGPATSDYLQSEAVLLNPNCEAGGLFLEYHNVRSFTELDRATLFAILKESLIRDDYNCQGYFMWADFFWRYSIYGMLPPEGGAELMQVAVAEGADTVDIPETKMTQGILELILNRDLSSASPHFLAAYERDESSEPFGRWWSLVIALNGDVQKALEVYEESASFWPREPSVRIYRAMYLYWLERYEESLAAAEESIGRGNTSPAMVQKAKALIGMGDLTQAEEMLLQAVELPGPQEAWAYLGYLYGRTGRRARARDALGRARHIPNDDPSHFVSDAFPALVYMGMGDTEAALESLRQAAASGDPTLLQLINDPLLEPIREQAWEIAFGTRA